MAPAFWLGERGWLLETCNWAQHSLLFPNAAVRTPAFWAHSRPRRLFPRSSIFQLGWLDPEPNLLWKSLELGLGKDEVVSVCRLLVAERCALLVEAAEGQWQVASPGLEHMQPTAGQKCPHRTNGRNYSGPGWLFLANMPLFPLARAAGQPPPRLASSPLQPMPSTEGSFPGKCDVGPAKGNPRHYSGLWKTGAGKAGLPPPGVACGSEHQDPSKLLCGCCTICGLLRGNRPRD